MDIDNNGKNDFAIGAPFSNKVVLLSTKQSIFIKPNSILTHHGGGAINPHIETG